MSKYKFESDFNYFETNLEHVVIKARTDLWILKRNKGFIVQGNEEGKEEGG